MFAANTSFLLLKKIVLLCIIAIVLETSSISPKLILSMCCIILTTLSGSCAFWSNAHGWGAGGGLETTSGSLETTSGSLLSLSTQLCPVKPPSHSREKSVWQSLPSSEPWQTHFSRRKPTTPGKWLLVPSPQGKGVGWQALGEPWPRRRTC